jgi:hypothetical protein
MNKSDLVLEVARAAGLTREVSEAVVMKELRAIVNPQAVPEKVHA